MASSNSARRTVRLDDVRQNNIVLVDLNENLTKPVFGKEYQKAAQIISSIIENSKVKMRRDAPNCSLCKNRSCSSCKHRDQQGCRGSDTRKYSMTEFQTAVPFIGDRGTGKSSVMCSVLESLRYYRGGNENAALYLGEKNDDVRFITFDMIDANTLKSRENIMEIILSRMLSYLEDIQLDCDFRELYRQINELHEDLGLVYWKNTDKREGYGLAALQRVADSQKTINSFRKLVEQFTQEVSVHLFGGAPCYLVIALDDIDMYQGAKDGMRDSQFALLEHIYNHMRIPGLIVLVTYNEHILRHKCNEHFARVYFGDRKPAVYPPSMMEEIEGLTAQFMSKLFPQERRIYLPNYLFVNAENRSNLYVKPTLCVEEENLELTTLFDGYDELPVKEFILRLIAHKTGVFFDIAGRKKHFFEPRNLRELGELFQIICAMKKIPEAIVDQAKVREYNRQELLNYLYNQFALRYLSSEEYRKFTQLSVLPLERQGRTLVDQIREQRRDLQLPADHVAYLDRTKRDRWKYSYGELLHNIYFSTRMPGKLSDDRAFYSKELIHCILGVHSVIMNQNVGDAACGETELVRTVMGSSVAGRWANEMLPGFYYGESRITVGAGSLSIPIRHFFDWEIPAQVQNSVLDLHKAIDTISKANNNTKTRRKSSSIREVGGETVKALIQYLEAFAIIGMFFTGFPDNGLKIAVEFDADENQIPTMHLRSESEDHICFNVMNFVINLYGANENGVGYLHFIRSKLLKLGDELAEQMSRDWEEEIILANRQRMERVEKLRKEDPYRFSTDIPVEEMNDLQIQNETRRMQKAEVWLGITYAYQFDIDVFKAIWKRITEGVCEKIEREIRKWHATYHRFPMVLPVQHFDMMYNIIKRLASDYYHDIPEEASVDEVYDYYARLYESVSKELEEQDEAYHLVGSESFAQAFRDSVFYKAFNAPQESRNPYIKEILVAMMKKALPGQSGRMGTAGLSDRLPVRL